MSEHDIRAVSGDPLSVGCPTCGVEPGQRCQWLMNDTVTLRQHAHLEERDTPHPRRVKFAGVTAANAQLDGMPISGVEPLYTADEVVGLVAERDHYQAEVERLRQGWNEHVGTRSAFEEALRDEVADLRADVGRLSEVIDRRNADIEKLKARLSKYEDVVYPEGQP